LLRARAPARSAASRYLLWGHRAISNLKAWPHGTHRRPVPTGPRPIPEPVRLPPQTDAAIRNAAFQTLLGLSPRPEPVSYRQIIDEAA
jgi:hypothetical protein